MALPSPLFEDVPMPKTSEPVTEVVPPAGTDGNSIIVPLLSAKNGTGFCTWSVSEAVVGLQLVGLEEQTPPGHEQV